MARQDLAWPMNFQGLEQHLPLSVLSQGLLPRHDVAKPVSTMYEENRRSKGFREQYDTYRNALPLSALCKCVHTHTQHWLKPLPASPARHFHCEAAASCSLSALIFKI